MNNGLTTWKNIFSPMSSEADRFFDEWSPSQSFAPPCDIYEAADHYLVTLELAGMNKDDIHIEVNDGKLVVSGERHDSRTEKEEGQRYTERRFGKFQRVFGLSQDLDADQVEAHYQDGVLKVFVPKIEAAKPKRVKVKTTSEGSRFLGKIRGGSEDQKAAS